MNLNREELAWAAGFFDGEGTCHTWTSRPGAAKHGRTCGLIVSQVEAGPLERFQKAVLGIGTIYYNRENSRGAGGKRAKPISNWQVHAFEQTQAVIALLWTFLSGPKKQQIIKHLAKFHAFQVASVGRPKKKDFHGNY